jgi:hypothetical protein
MSEESNAPEMQKYVFGTLDFGQSTKVKESELQCTVFATL